MSQVLYIKHYDTIDVFELILKDDGEIYISRILESSRIFATGLARSKSEHLAYKYLLCTALLHFLHSKQNRYKIDKIGTVEIEFQNVSKY